MPNSQRAIALEILELVAGGYHISVRKLTDDARIIQAKSGRGDVKRSFTLALTPYDAVLADVVSGLAARHGRQLRVEIKGDFYGNHWAEVRSGVLGWQMSRIIVSPRHLNALEQALKAREAEPKAAGLRSGKEQRPQ